MIDTPPSETQQEPRLSPPKHHRWWRRIAVMVGVLIGCYVVVAYVALPVFWIRYTRHHPSLADIPNITHTVDGILGDPLNVALIGTETELKRIMRAAQRSTAWATSTA